MTKTTTTRRVAYRVYETHDGEWQISTHDQDDPNCRRWNLCRRIVRFGGTDHAWDDWEWVGEFTSKKECVEVIDGIRSGQYAL